MSRLSWSRRFGWAVCALAALAGGWLARSAPLTAADDEQARLNIAAPAPHGSTTIGQTLVAGHNGLSSIELLAVVYPGASLTSTLNLQLTDERNHDILSRTVSSLQHNAPLRLDFAPQPHSAGQTYTLTLTGSPDNTASVWAYSLDGYGRGAQLLDGQPTSGDLRFTTTYTYLWRDAALNALTGLGRVALWIPLLWLLLFAPGQLVLGMLFPISRWPLSFSARAGLALALSLSALPLLWLWVSTFGLRLSPIFIAAAYAVIAGWILWRGLRQMRRSHWSLSAVRFSPATGVLLIVMLLSLVTRLLAARDLAFPMWVDSSHHLTIAQVLAQTSRIPTDYQPVLPVDNFIYHFGYHVLLVSAQWLTGRHWPELMLTLGQVLNAMAPLAVYTLVELLTRRPQAGVAAAFVVALVSYFPGYYLSWGRYTQLTGVLVLAPLLGVTWRMVAPTANRWASAYWREGLGLGLLIAGMIFVHYRMLAFFVTFALVALAAGGRGGWKWLGGGALLGSALAAPWLWQLFQQAVLPVVIAPQRLAATNSYNAFPWDYFRSDLERGWMALALIALAWGLMRRERALWLIGGWVALTFALLNIGPGTWLVNNNAWAITLFMPGAVALGWGADEWWRGVTALMNTATPASRWMAGRLTLGAAMLALFTGVIIFAGWRGLYLQISTINPTTRLATADDAEAIEWVARNTPPEAVFAINGWKWLGATWAGSDGGAWVWPLTGRRTTLPPIDYTYQPDWAVQVANYNARLSTVTDANAPDTLALWREGGVTHIFIGAKGGSLKPEMFTDSPHYRLLFSNGAAWVFAVVQP